MQGDLMSPVCDEQDPHREYEMNLLSVKHNKTRFIAISAATSAALVIGIGSALADASQSGEQKNMRRVGHVDLQGRSAYQPNVIKYPNGKTIAFVGTHNGSAPNPLNGGAIELNGTMIVDVTDPKHPKEKFHIPAPAGGQSQMVRMCLGKDLPGSGDSSKVFLLRNVQGGASSGFELWDVSNVTSPTRLSALTGIRNTHKLWWECTTGIAYMPGSRDVPSPDRWRVGQQMVIYDWNPALAGGNAQPTYIRTFGLPGAEPDSTSPVLPPTLHGPISAFEHPNAAGALARAAGPDDVIGNRIYMAYGVGDDGVLQILDRKKLLPGKYGGTWDGIHPDRPTAEELMAPQVGILHMSPDQGGHTSFPVFGLQPKGYQNYNEFKTRDIVLLASEATSNLCNEAPHWSFVVDVTVENSLTAPPGTRVETDPWQGPMVIATMSVDPRTGEKYPRGNYCTRGARFGVHSSEENFRNPYYGRLTFLAYFTGGVRAWDIREPQAPVEVGFYVPVSNANTAASGYMTNNLEVDNRGYIYASDRGGAGLDILELRGDAKTIGLGKGKGHGDHDDDDDDHHDRH
ncbi:MAG: hypothetical protein WCE38_19635 [Burkholderiales bacterium]